MLIKEHLCDLDMARKVGISKEEGRDMLYAGTKSGVVTLRRSGGAWESGDWGLKGKDVSSLSLDRKDAGRVYAGVFQEGVYQSQDGGRTWELVVKAHVWSVLAAPDDDGTVYVGVEPAGVLRGAGGQWDDLIAVRSLPSAPTWSFPAPPHFPHVRTLAVHSSSPQTIYGGVEVGGVIRSLDRGQTWEELNKGIYEDVHTLAIAPSAPEVLYAATGAGFYRSHDGGNTWERACYGMKHTYTVPIAVHPQEPHIVFTAAAKGPPPSWGGPDGAAANIYRSDDSARSWELVTNGLPDPFKGMVYALAVDAHEPDTVYAGTAEGEIYWTRDCGSTWQLLMSGLPPIRGLLAA